VKRTPHADALMSPIDPSATSGGFRSLSALVDTLG
jgi:hypothetical protein